MPIPKPKTGEDKDAFISRCISDPVMQSEYEDNDQRIAICETSWTEKRSDFEDNLDTEVKFIAKDEDGFERIVFAEVLIPDVPNTHGDYHTKASVRDFAYGFMLNGFGIDLNHNNNDVSSSVSVIESFIARKGDPDFQEGSWVVGLHVADDYIWEQILSGELNGYSYEATVYRKQAVMDVPVRAYASGVTEPDPFDGHTHEFVVMLDDEERPIIGGTSETQGHSHTISTHTYTDKSFEHSHIFNYSTSYGA